jgi:hypothetical protein
MAKATSDYPKHPSFRGRIVTEQEHERCLASFGTRHERLVLPVLDGFGLYERGHVHETPHPCIYVFRHRALYVAEKRSRFLHCQKHRDAGVQFVFIRSRRLGFTPLPDNIWLRMERDWLQPQWFDKWRGFSVVTDVDIPRAREWMAAAVDCYDRFFGPAAR